MSTRTKNRRRPTAEQNPRNTPATPERPHLTLIDLRKPLPTRNVVGPHSALELTCSRAALATATARLPIPVINWHALPNGRAAAYMRDDTLIVHTATDGRAPHFTALVPCPHGLRHQHPVTDERTLAAARTATAACTSPHATDDQAQSLTEGVRPAPAPTAPTIRPLTDAFGHDAERTQPLSANDIAAGLNARTAAADKEQPKEHPAS
ncbi:hypothetical protein [Streptomyces sp. NPDC058297]|uniref:hypothetical protein n=1 Tax=Streptomyces sp. NPDC058297 TaxID=3346433 RepID=UPI0036EE8800